MVCDYIKARKEEVQKFQNDPQTEVRPSIHDVLMHTIHTDEVKNSVIFGNFCINLISDGSKAIPRCKSKSLEHS